MLYNLLRKHKDIVRKYSVKKFRVVGNSRELVIPLIFIDGSSLHARDYIFHGRERKYSFHRQDKKGDLIMRWDNQPHWKNIRTFPHHKHQGDGVQESKEHNLADVLRFIARNLRRDNR